MPPDTNNDEGIVKPTAARMILVMIGLCMTVFLTGMDQTILATAVPVISNEFNTSADFGWWSNAYLLTLSSFQLFYGKLYAVFPIKNVYLTAIVLFEIGSLVCTVAPDSLALIIGRALAGLGAAGIFSGGVMTLTKLVPLAERAAYLGVMSAVFGLAAIIGPFLGAALIQSSTWRWCFGINLPLGAVAVVLCAIFIRTPVDPSGRTLSLATRLGQLDIPGTVCMVASVICLLMALQWGGGTYPWSDGRVIALFVVAGVLGIAFLVIQKTTVAGKASTIPSSVARNRDIWLAGVYAMCITGGVYVSVLYLPVWFQDIRGRSPLSSGAMLTPLIGGYVVGSIVAGALTSGIGYYSPAMLVGTAFAVVGSAFLTTVNLDVSTARIIGYELLYGFGVGFGFGGPSYVVQTLLPTADVPIGVTFITLLQNLSASVFTAVAQSIFQSEMRRRLAPLLPAADAASLLGSGLAQILAALPPQSQAAAAQALSESIVLTFYVTLALSCVSIVCLGIKWSSMKRTDVLAGAAAGAAEAAQPTDGVQENSGAEKNGLSAHGYAEGRIGTNLLGEDAAMAGRDEQRRV